MTEILWFACGAALAALAMWYLAPKTDTAVEVSTDSASAGGDSPHEAPDLAEPSAESDMVEPKPELAEPKIDQPEIDASDVDEQPSETESHSISPTDLDEVQPLITVVGRELSGLTSAVHGSAELLLDALGDSRVLPTRAANLWAAVSRIQRYGRKLLSFAEERALDRRERFSVHSVLDDVQRELQEDTMGSLEIDLHVARTLPPVLGSPLEFRDSLHYLVDSLLSLEPETQQILIHALHLLDRDHPAIHVEMTVLSHADGNDPLGWIRLRLGFQAARLAVERMGGALALEYDPGDKASLFITLPASPSAEPSDLDSGEPEELVPSPPAAAPHRFGGVLVLESDPILRDIISQVLRDAGRSFTTCADGESAQALLTATPERFELLVLEQNARLMTGEKVARDALAENPEIKILLLGGEPMDDDTPDPRIQVLVQPFSRRDLIRAFETLIPSRIAPELDPSIPDEV